MLHIFVKQLLRACAEEAFKAFLGLRHNIKECSEGVEESVLTSDQVPDIEEKRAKLAEFLERTVRLRRVPETFDCEKASIEEEDYDEACTGDEYRLGDPLSRLSVEDILSVEGRRDPEGRPLGRCLVLLRTGDEVGGVWRDGVREGLGTVRGPSLEERGIRSIRGKEMECCVWSLVLVFRLLPERPPVWAGSRQPAGRDGVGDSVCPEPRLRASGDQLHQDGV